MAGVERHCVVAGEQKSGCAAMKMELQIGKPQDSDCKGVEFNYKLSQAYYFPTCSNAHNTNTC